MEVLPAEKRMHNARLSDGQNKQFALTHGSRPDVFCEILDGKTVLQEQGTYRLRIQSMAAERRAEHSALNRTIAFTVREEQAAARTEPSGKKGDTARPDTPTEHAITNQRRESRRKAVWVGNSARHRAEIMLWVRPMHLLFAAFWERGRCR